jgi:PRC-barrel domain
MEAVMKTYYVFKSQSAPDLRGFTDDPSGSGLPPEDGPWALAKTITPDAKWDLDVSRAVVAAAINNNGFYLSGTRPQWSAKAIIESDRVEGTAVYDPQGNQIGTIKRLLIEKASGRVLYVDITFGGFLGIGVHHHTIPWEKLAYDRDFGGYRTDVTAEQVRGAPSFFGDAEIWHDRNREQQMRDYWSRSM